MSELVVGLATVTCGVCGERMDVSDATVENGSPTFMGHIKENHPELWAAIARIDARLERAS